MLRMLLADPDPSVRVAYANFFSQVGFDFEAAANGLECIEKLRSGGAEILVVDSSLAWGGAEGIFDVINSDPNVPWVPVTIATGEADPQELAARFELPLHCCLRKPYRLVEVLGKIRGSAVAAGLPATESASR